VRKVETVANYFILMLFSVFALFPLLWMLTTALKPVGQTFHYPPQWLPKPVTLENFIRVFSQLPFFNYALNTIYVTLLVLIGQLVFCTGSAYAFARLRFPARDLIFTILALPAFVWVGLVAQDTAPNDCCPHATRGAGHEEPAGVRACVSTVIRRPRISRRALAVKGAS
jgi:ABC-type glycerol-3-phosphate transport system permease component